MQKFLTTGLAALTFAGAMAATATPAAAQRYYGGGNHYRHHHGSNDAAVAIAAGVAGLALGSALSSSGSHQSYYRDSYSYAPQPYYGGGYGGYSGYYEERYYAPPRVCISRERVWDPYIGRRVVIERRYAC